MSDRVTDLAFQLADGAARSDIETLCTYVGEGAEEVKTCEDFAALWIDVTKVSDHEDMPFVQIALEYLELRGMLKRNPDNPDWLRVLDEPTILQPSAQSPGIDAVKVRGDAQPQTRMECCGDFVTEDYGVLGSRTECCGQPFEVEITADESIRNAAFDAALDACESEKREVSEPLSTTNHWNNAIHYCMQRITSLKSQPLPSQPEPLGQYSKDARIDLLEQEQKKLRQSVQEFDENMKYLLDSYDGSIRNRYKHGDEDLVASMCVTFIKLRDIALSSQPSDDGRGKP